MTDRQAEGKIESGKRGNEESVNIDKRHKKRKQEKRSRLSVDLQLIQSQVDLLSTFNPLSLSERKHFDPSVRPTDKLNSQIQRSPR